jgi:adenosylcobinamide amidohydrolase
MKKIMVSMLIGFGDSQESGYFEVRVPEDWDPSAKNLGAICEEFRREAILDVEDVLCDGCGYSVMEGICQCDEDGEDVA